VGSGKYNNLVFYLYFLITLINKFGKDGSNTERAHAYLLNHIISTPNDDTTMSYCFPEEAEYVFPERMMRTVVDLLPFIGQVFNRFRFVVVPEVIKNMGDEVISRLRLYLEKGLYVGLVISEHLYRIIEKYGGIYYPDIEEQLKADIKIVEEGPSASMNHALTIVGIEGNTMRIKNSAGTSWSDHGYMKFDMNILRDAKKMPLLCIYIDTHPNPSGVKQIVSVPFISSLSRSRSRSLSRSFSRSPSRNSNKSGGRRKRMTRRR